MKKRKSLFLKLLIIMLPLAVALMVPMRIKASFNTEHNMSDCEHTECVHYRVVNVNTADSTFLCSNYSCNGSIWSSKLEDSGEFKFSDLSDPNTIPENGYIYYLDSTDNKLYLCHSYYNEHFEKNSSNSICLLEECRCSCGISNCDSKIKHATYSLKNEDRTFVYGEEYNYDDILNIVPISDEYSIDQLKAKIKIVSEENNEAVDTISQVGEYSIMDTKDCSYLSFRLAYKVEVYGVDGNVLETSYVSKTKFKIPEYSGIVPDGKEFAYWSTDLEGNSCYMPGDSIGVNELNGNISIYPIFKDSDKSDKSDHAEIPNSSNNSQPAKEEVKEEVKEEPVVTRTYVATENTTTDSWNKAYVSDGNNSHGNLGNHYKAVAPASISNNDVSGWDSIKTDIASKTDSELAITAYEVNMNTSTRVDNSTLDLLSSKELPYARFKLENKTTFVLPTNLSAKNTESFASASDNKANFYIDITSNTTNDVNNKVIDTQFVPLNLIKSVKGNENSRIIAVRTNNQDLTNIGAVKLARTDASKTKVSLYLYDKTNNALKPCGTYDYDANGMAVVYVSLTNWNLVAVEE